MMPDKLDIAAVVVAGILVLSVMAAYQHIPACDDPPVLREVTDQFRRDHQFSGVIITGIIRIRGYLYHPRSCRALLAESTGDSDFDARHWIEIEYRSPIQFPSYKILGEKIKEIHITVK